jgi:hypothetical protein
VLSGSDPLPVPGEERLAGSCHCTFSIPALEDPTRLVAPLKAALTSGSLAIRHSGASFGPLAVWHRLRGNARAKAACESGTGPHITT